MCELEIGTIYPVVIYQYYYLYSSVLLCTDHLEHPQH